jgi:hypothetical protein
MGTHRRRLPQGRSWPLRPSQIVDVLAELEAPQPTQITKSGTARTDTVTLIVRWQPESWGPFASWEGGDEQVWVSFNSAPSDVRADVERAMLSEAIPALAEWLRRASTAPEGWRVLEHRHDWTWAAGRIISSGDDVP